MVGAEPLHAELQNHSTALLPEILEVANGLAAKLVPVKAHSLSYVGEAHVPCVCSLEESIASTVLGRILTLVVPVMVATIQRDFLQGCIRT